MPKFSLILPLALALGLSACSGPITPEQESMKVYPQVHLTDSDLAHSLVVREPYASRVGAGQLQVDIPIRNLTDNDLILDYQYRFLGLNGQTVEQPSGWHNFRIAPRSMTDVKITSMTPEARDFDVTIRPAQ